MNQTRRTLLEKQRQAHKWCTPMDPTYGWAKAGQPAQTYIQQLCEGMGCRFEDLPEAMNNREKWREGQGYPCKRHDMMMMIWKKIHTAFIHPKGDHLKMSGLIHQPSLTKCNPLINQLNLLWNLLFIFSSNVYLNYCLRN